LERVLDRVELPEGAGAVLDVTGPEIALIVGTRQLGDWPICGLSQQLPGDCCPEGEHEKAGNTNENVILPRVHRTETVVGLALDLKPYLWPIRLAVSATRDECPNSRYTRPRSFDHGATLDVRARREPACPVTVPTCLPRRCC
jgi:hypothetical protein